MHLRRPRGAVRAITGLLGGCALTLAACGGPSAAGAGPAHARAHVGPIRAARSPEPKARLQPGVIGTIPVPPASSPITTVPAPGPTTSPPLPAPGPGFLPGHVTAIGDSVMIDYQDALAQDIPGVMVDAVVSRQWSTGVALVQQLHAAGQLGAVVIVGLGTNGPIASADFDRMMAALAGASRVVFVTVNVDQPWQDSVNAVLAAGVARYPRTVLADWHALAAANTQWLYADGTHLPIDGPGAQALAHLVASKA